MPWRGLIPLMTLAGLGLEIAEIRMPREAHTVGLQIRQLSLPEDSLICLVISNGVPRLPAPDTTIHADDILIAVTKIETEEALRSALAESQTG